MYAIMYAMSDAKYRMVRLRRPDVLRIQKELKKLGGTFLTDFFHACSYMTVEEFIQASAKAATRKMAEYQRRRDAGEVPVQPEELQDDAEEHRINEANTEKDTDR